MAARETGKQRAARIPLDYFKRPDWIQRWKGWLGGAALVVSLGWVAVALLWSDEGRAGESRGPVTAVHATWEHHCAACHVAFTPITGNTWFSSLVSDPHASAQRCASCHAGPPHHDNQIPDLDCAACHRDHRGRDASLVRLADSDCTQCHQNLAQHLKDGKPAYQDSVSRFDAEHHPEFRSIQGGDPGRLKFNHKLHMTFGMAGKDGGPVWTLGQIPPEYRDRYARQQKEKGASAWVQLQCLACHQLDNGDFGRTEGRSLAPGTGAYMQPITYENQCQACHPLTFGRRVAGDRNSPALAVPHGLQPQEVRDFLWGAYANQYVAKKHPELLKPPFRPLPGKDLGADEKAARKEIGNLVADYEKYLYRDKLEAAEKMVFLGHNTCGECHHYQRREGEIVPERILPTNVPQVWFKHAVFDHNAHRALDCRACHKRAPTSVVSTDVLLPGRDVCLRCHAPQTAAGGGARFDCTECHRYHHRNNKAFRTQGRGAGARGPGNGVFHGIDDFLSDQPKSATNAPRP